MLWGVEEVAGVVAIVLDLTVVDEDVTVLPRVNNPKSQRSIGGKVHFFYCDQWIGITYLMLAVLLSHWYY